MLILSRKVGEALVIGDIELEVVAVDDTAGETKFVFTSVSFSNGEFALKLNEVREFAEGVSVKLVRMGHSVARLGVESPRSMPIYRKELRGP